MPQKYTSSQQFGRLGSVGLVWEDCFGRFGLVGLVWLLLDKKMMNGNYKHRGKDELETNEWWSGDIVI